MRVDHGVGVNFSIIIDPLRQSGGVSFRDNKGRRHNRAVGWVYASSFKVLVDQLLPSLLVLLGAVICALDEGLFGIL